MHSNTLTKLTISLALATLVGCGGGGSSPPPAPPPPAAPVLTVTPTTTIDLGNVTYNVQSGNSTVTIKNTGDAALGINNISITGAYAADFVKSGSCQNGGTVVPTATCDVVFYVKPAGENKGAQTVNLNIGSNAGDKVIPIAYVSVVPPPQTPVISVSPTAANIGKVDYKAQSANNTVTVTNAGTAAMKISDISFSGSYAADFIKTGSCAVGATLAPTASCDVVYAVKTTGNYSGAQTVNLTIASDGGNKTVPVSYISATPPQILLDKNALDYPNTVIGAEQAKQMKITNVGGSPLVISRLYLIGTGEFMQNNDCPAQLATDVSCVVNVKPFPATAGDKKGFLTVFSNDPTKEQLYVSLSALGVTGTPLTTQVTPNPSLEVTTHDDAGQALAGQQEVNFSQPYANTPPSPVVIGVSSSRYFINLKNTGATDIALGSFRAVGPENDWFVVGGAGIPTDAGYHAPCTATLPAGATCDIGVDLKPLTLGIATLDKLEIWAANNSTKFAEVNLKGQSSDKAALDYSLLNLDFGTALVGSPVVKTVQIKNIGPKSQPMVVTGMTVVIPDTATPLPDFVVTHDCASVPALGSCTATVTFAPTIMGSIKAELRVANDAVNFYKALPISGAGAAAAQ